MSEVTLKAIEDLLDKKFDEKLKPVNTKIDRIDAKADRTSVLVVDLTESLREVPATLKSIARTLDSHTAVLEQLLTKKKTKDEEKIVSAERFDRLEHWAVLAGKKLGIKLEL